MALLSPPTHSFLSLSSLVCECNPTQWTSSLDESWQIVYLLSKGKCIGKHILLRAL